MDNRRPYLPGDVWTQLDFRGWTLVLSYEPTVTYIWSGWGGNDVEFVESKDKSQKDFVCDMQSNRWTRVG